MGSMSASDAAPLPRMGEVFFDVRGNSRTMRLSWYADTGVAVLSIWQGGMCTGTFRLAIADLPRLVETLRRGPDRQAPGQDPAVPGQAFAAAPVGTTGDAPPIPGDYHTAPAARPAEPAGYRPRLPEYPADQDYQAQAAAGPAQYPADPDDYETYAAAGPAQYPADPDDYQTRTAGYPGGPVPYPADPVGYQTHAPGYPASPAQYPPDPPGYQGRAADYSAPPSSRLGGPAGYPPGPGDYQGRAADYTAGLPGPPGYPPEPGERQSDYAAGPSGGRYLPDAWGGTDDGRYPGGAGPLGQGYPVPTAHYSRGSSAPGRGEGPGPSASDYPAHYGAAVSDDAPDGLPPDSFSYGQPAANRGAVTRHARPGAPFD
jgi:hypothetical protein